MNQKKFDKLTPAQQEKYLMNEEKGIVKNPPQNIDFNTLVVDAPNSVQKDHNRAISDKFTTLED